MIKVDIFANRLNCAMKLRGLKQVDLVEQSDMSKAKISQYVNGQFEPKSHGTFTLAKILNVSTEWLCGYDVPMISDDQPVQEVSAPSSLQVFENHEFGKVRSMCIDGEPWFVGKDVADALGYQNGSRDINRHVEKEDRQNYRNGTSEINNRGITIINESGLYSLIMSSQLPSAKKFKRWVTSEVLPAIRKTGQYQVQGHQVKPTTVGDVVNLIKTTRQAMKDQGSDPRDIAVAIKQICDQFDIRLPNCFVKPQETNLQDVFNMVDYIYSLPKGKGHAKPTYEDFIVHQATVKMLKG